MSELNRRNIKRYGSRVYYVDGYKKHWLIHDFFEDYPWQEDQFYARASRDAVSFAKHLRKSWSLDTFLRCWRDGWHPVEMAMFRGWFTAGLRRELRRSRLPLTYEGYKKWWGQGVVEMLPKGMEVWSKHCRMAIIHAPPPVTNNL